MLQFKKILIANRGEIAVRIAKTCQKLGIKSVAIYSFADRHALHTKIADEAYLVGPAESNASYLNIDAIVEIANKAGVDAVHPGYGFLSENSNFASALQNNKITFIGPSPEVITLMGDKIAAKETAKKVKLPLIPGASISGNDSLKLATDFIRTNGIPALIKAAAGGGGRGMRKVYAESDLEDLILGASREAKAFFNNGDLFIEKLVEKARHIEIQIISDGKTALALGDRDCSLQRNHQKVIEEAPAPEITKKTRDKMHKLAEELAESTSYKGAGTVEFLLDSNENFYFLEVNSRLQVEHPVTEKIFNLDLVELQIRVAEGHEIKNLLNKKQLKAQGHAIELRLCAEKPAKNFAAATGKLIDFSLDDSENKNFRFDTGFLTGDRVTHHYDSMLAKIIIHSESREQAIKDSIKALSNLTAAGVETNTNYLLKLLKSKAFRTCSHYTLYAETLVANEEELLQESAISAALCLLWDTCFNYKSNYLNNSLQKKKPSDTFEEQKNYALDKIGWNLSTDKAINRWYCVENSFYNVSLEFINKSTAEVKVDFTISQANSTLKTRTYNFTNIKLFNNHKISLVNEGEEIKFYVRSDRADRWLHSSLGLLKLTTKTPPLKTSEESIGGVSNEISSPLPGKIISIKAPEGTELEEGDAIIVIESMKMEHVLVSPLAATVKEILVKAGDVIEANSILARLNFT
ncbi:MAG: ATP-grasp domain-containing protein [Bdellovibrionales bacterium]|nr:ATP-grasp domain-containing protein [Bdellovibrionales bacterium]